MQGENGAWDKKKWRPTGCQPIGGSRCEGEVDSVMSSLCVGV